MSEEEVVESTEEVVEEVAEETPIEESSGSFVDSMLSQIDNEDIKSAGFWKNLEGKDANELGQYIKELNNFAGKKGDIPKSDATEEEWSAFYEKLGRPKSVEDYDFVIGDEFTELVGKESLPEFEQMVDSLKEKAFKIGANSDQAEELVDWFLETVATDLEETKKQDLDFAKQSEEALQKEWGDEYDGMMRGIEAMLLANGMPEENIEIAKQVGLLTDPALATTLGKIASKFSDDPEIGHHQTRTMAGLHDQLAEVNMDIQEYLKTGAKIPPHIAQKRLDLMNKLGDNVRN